MTKYAQAVKKEREIMDLFSSLGAVHVMRSAGSHGLADVHALFPEFSVYAQVKYGDDPRCGRKEREELVSLSQKLPYYAIICIVEIEKRKKARFEVINGERSVKAKFMRLVNGG